MVRNELRGTNSSLNDILLLAIIIFGLYVLKLFSRFSFLSFLPFPFSHISQNLNFTSLRLLTFFFPFMQTQTFPTSYTFFTYIVFHSNPRLAIADSASHNYPHSQEVSSAFTLPHTQSCICTGGTYSGSLEMAVTSVLIIPTPEGEKYTHACNWRIQCLTPDWIYDSVEQGHALDMEGYKVKKTRGASTPTNDMSVNGRYPVCV